MLLIRVSHSTKEITFCLAEKYGNVCSHRLLEEIVRHGKWSKYTRIEILSWAHTLNEDQLKVFTTAQTLSQVNALAQTLSQVNALIIFA